MGLYVADFETTTNIEKTYVWAYALCNIENPDEVIIGNNINDFIKWCEDEKENHTIYFHNLKFDART